MAEPIPLRTDASFTVAAWVRLGAANKSGTVISADGVRRSPFVLGYDADTKKWRFAMTTADSDGGPFSVASSANDAVPGGWTFLAGVYDAPTKQVRLYVDGVEQSATAVLPSAFNTTGIVRIGRRMGHGRLGSSFVGTVDETRIYNYAVRADALATLALPQVPEITFPEGDSVPQGARATAVLGAAGDVNIAHYRYSIDSPSFDQIAMPTTPGGPVTIEMPTDRGSSVTVYATSVHVDGRRSWTYTTARLSIVVPPVLMGYVMDAEANVLSGAVVTLEPSGLSAVTDANGFYQINDLTLGSYTMRATYGGECGLAAAYEDVRIDRGGPFSLDFMLFPTC